MKWKLDCVARELQGLSARLGHETSGKVIPSEIDRSNSENDAATQIDETIFNYIAEGSFRNGDEGGADGGVL